MKEFACKNLGIDCDFVASGEAQEEVLQKAMAHGGTVHANLMDGMSQEESAAFAQKLEASIITI